MTTLPRIRAGLLRHQLEDQVLVYDQSSEKIHLLDRTTGAVLELLQEGGWTREGILVELRERFQIDGDQSLLLLAFEEVRRIGLVEEESTPIQAMPDATRRDLIKKLAATGAVALLIPAVTTLTASTAYGQASSLRGNGSACTLAAQCASGLCCNGFCASTCNVANGSACPNGNSQCASGICCGGLCSGTACGSTVECGTCQTTAQCTGGFNCNSGVCSNGNKVGIGQPCNGNGNCCSGNCNKTTNTCAA